MPELIISNQATHCAASVQLLVPRGICDKSTEQKVEVLLHQLRVLISLVSYGILATCLHTHVYI